MLTTAWQGKWLGVAEVAGADTLTMSGGWTTFQHDGIGCRTFRGFRKVDTTGLDVTCLAFVWGDSTWQFFRVHRV